MARAISPDWPALMRRATAARYCDMTAVEFEGEVTAQRLPMPVRLGNEDRWSRRSLDDALERHAGAAEPDWRAGSALYAQG